jgi:hypothetical protein
VQKLHLREPDFGGVVVGEGEVAIGGRNGPQKGNAKVRTALDAAGMFAVFEQTDVLVGVTVWTGLQVHTFSPKQAVGDLALAVGLYGCCGTRGEKDQFFGLVS